MKLNFTKMQGAGNDYIYIDCRAAGLPPDAAAWAVQLSRRHFSVGADGVIYLCPPLRADGDAAMRMFNADGSEGVMCGNGVRCAAEFLYTHGVRRDCIRIDTPSAGSSRQHAAIALSAHLTADINLRRFNWIIACKTCVTVTCLSTYHLA